MAARRSCRWRDQRATQTPPLSLAPCPLRVLTHPSCRLLIGQGPGGIPNQGPRREFLGTQTPSSLSQPHLPYLPCLLILYSFRTRPSRSPRPTTPRGTTCAPSSCPRRRAASRPASRPSLRLVCSHHSITLPPPFHHPSTTLPPPCLTLPPLSISAGGENLDELKMAFQQVRKRATKNTNPDSNPCRHPDPNQEERAIEHSIDHEVHTFSASLDVAYNFLSS